MANVKRNITLTLATGFGCGFLPWAPGSWGAAVAAIAGWWLVDLPLAWFLAIIGIVFVVGTLVAKNADAHLSGNANNHYDNDKIVIDEWVGMLITLLPFYFFEKSLLYLGIAFLMFRIFDTLKFGIAKVADSWHNRWGVMLDDFFAGLHSAIFFFFALWIMEML